MTRVALYTKTIKRLKSVSSELNFKTKKIPEIIEKLCNEALELSKLVRKLTLPSIYKTRIFTI